MSIVHPKFKSSCNPNKVERNFYKVWSEMKRRCGVKREALVQRRDKGWSDEDIIRPFRNYSQVK